MSAAVITALILISIVLALLCGVLAWLWRDQRQKTIMLARQLADLLSASAGDSEKRARWLRAVDDADCLPPDHLG